MTGEEAVDDALLDGWDAYVLEGRFDEHRLSTQDQEVITMLHARTSTPVPSESFTRELRSRLTAVAAQGSRTHLNPSDTLPVVPIVRPPFAGVLRNVQSHRLGIPSGLRLAAATVLVLTLVASLGGRLRDDAPSPTVQAPVAQVTADSPNASPVTSPAPGWATCSEFTDARPFGKPMFIDPSRALELRAPLESARTVTIQELTATDSGDVTPNSYFTSGVTGVVVDTVVIGAVRVRLTAAGNTMVPDGISGDMVGHSVAPLEWVDVLQGDTLIYPVGALATLFNTQEDRDLLILRVVFHDVPDLLSGSVSDTVTLRTTGQAALPIDLVSGSTSGFVVTLDYVSFVLRRELPTAPCDGDGRFLIAEALQLQQTDRGPRLFGLLAWVQPLTFTDE